MADKTAKIPTRKQAYRDSSFGDRVFDICNYVFMLLLVVITLYPFLNTLAVSMNSAMDSIRGGIYLWPRELSAENYKYIFKDSQIYQATLISFLRMIIGTVVTVLCSAIVAYTISRQEFVLRRFITIAFVLTMYVNPGIIPNFLLIRDLHLVNSFWVYIWPGLIGVFNLILIRSFIQTLPDSILESGRIDGAGDLKTFTHIVLPLLTPVLATVALFSAVGHWNSWIDVFLYNSSNEKLSTLQYELQKILQNSSASTSKESAFNNPEAMSSMVTPLAVRASMTIVASVPMIIMYPFFQRYFVKGMMVGGVKE